jgi:hypothetical protein
MDTSRLLMLLFIDVLCSKLFSTSFIQIGAEGDAEVKAEDFNRGIHGKRF